MRILVVAATENEVLKTKSFFKEFKTIEFLVTGVGMTLTAYLLTKKIQHQKFDLIINAGIAGAFHNSISIGDVVAVNYDFFAELGAENNDHFITFPHMNLPGEYAFKNHSSIKSKLFQQLKQVKSATVNKVHGNEISIKQFLLIHDTDIESMEGAAVALVCEKENLPYIQLRSISNYVTSRNTKEWDIPLAISNLNNILTSIIKEIYE